MLERYVDCVTWGEMPKYPAICFVFSLYEYLIFLLIDLNLLCTNFHFNLFLTSAQHGTTMGMTNRESCKGTSVVGKMPGLVYFDVGVCMILIEKHC